MAQNHRWILRGTQAVVALSAALFFLLGASPAWSQTTLTLMGWNIRAQGATSTWPDSSTEIISYLSSSGADIICLQEINSSAVDEMENSILGSQYDFYEGDSDNPILINNSLSLGGVFSSPSGVGRCSPGTVAAISLLSGSSFEIYNSHFCFDNDGINPDENFLDGRRLRMIAAPTSSDWIVAIGDLNSNSFLNPNTISYLLNFGFRDTWADVTGNPLPKRDVEWILVNDAMVNGALNILNTTDDDSCTASTSDGKCSDHRAFFVDIELP